MVMSSEKLRQVLLANLGNRPTPRTIGGALADLGGSIATGFQLAREVPRLRAEEEAAEAKSTADRAGQEVALRDALIGSGVDPAMAGGIASAEGPVQTALLNRLPKPVSPVEEARIGALKAQTGLDREQFEFRKSEAQRTREREDAARQAEIERQSRVESLIRSAQAGNQEAQSALAAETFEQAPSSALKRAGVLETSPQVEVNLPQELPKQPFLDLGKDELKERQKELRSLGNINANLAPVENALKRGVQTGFGAETLLPARRAAAALGIGDIEALSDLELIQSIASRIAPQMRATGSGSSSDRDVQLFLQSIADLSRTPEGNLKIIQNFKSLADRKKQEQRILEDMISAGEFLPSRFLERADALGPVFNEDQRRELEDAAGIMAVNAAQPATPQTAEEVQALPPGTPFINPATGQTLIRN